MKILIDQKKAIDLALRCYSQEELAKRLQDEGLSVRQAQNIIYNKHLMEYVNNNIKSRNDCMKIKSQDSQDSQDSRLQQIFKSNFCAYKISKNCITFSKKEFNFSEINEIVLDLLELQKILRR